MDLHEISQGEIRIRLTNKQRTSVFHICNMLTREIIVGQRILAAALNTPVAVMETAGEGGAWGIAILAAYLVNNSAKETLADYLEAHVFADAKGSCVDPIPEDVASYEKFLRSYRRGLAIERAAVDNFK